MSYSLITAHTFNCVCHSIRSMFRVLGIYNFDCSLKSVQLLLKKNIHIIFNFRKHGDVFGQCGKWIKRAQNGRHSALYSNRAYGHFGGLWFCDTFFPSYWRQLTQWWGWSFQYFFTSWLQVNNYEIVVKIFPYQP